MPTKEKLAAEAVTLGELLKVTVDTTGTHAELSALVKALKAKAEAGEAKADTDPPPPPASEPEQPATTETPKPKAAAGRYVVAAGRSIYAMRGHLKAGTAIRPGDFSSEELSALAAKGVLTKG